MVETGTPEGGAVLLSVVIRCRNEADSLRKVMGALSVQVCDFPWEVVVVDNASEDGTAEICEDFGARRVVLPKNSFTYGRAINLGFEAARGELVLLLSAHAMPLGSSFLAKCIEPFADPEVVAARCSHVTLKQQAATWFTPKVIQYPDNKEQDRIESGPSNWASEYPVATCGVYRRATWERVSFDETLEAFEDIEWASRALRQGGKIYSCAEAFFVYTRERSTLDEIRKQRRQRLAMYRVTGKPSISWPTFFRKTFWCLVNTPVVGARHVTLSLIKYYGLVMIPIHARRQMRVGSLSEFDVRR